MDKLKLKGRNLGRVFKSRLGCFGIDKELYTFLKQPNLKLKTRPKKLLGYLLLAFKLPAFALQF